MLTETNRAAVLEEFEKEQYRLSLRPAQQSFIRYSELVFCSLALVCGCAIGNDLYLVMDCQRLQATSGQT